MQIGSGPDVLDGVNCRIPPVSSWYGELYANLVLFSKIIGLSVASLLRDRSRGEKVSCCRRELLDQKARIGMVSGLSVRGIQRGIFYTSYQRFSPHPT